MDFSTNDCDWSRVTVNFLNRKITGLRGFEFKKTVEKEAIYASGIEPVDIRVGNKKYEGNLKVLKYEVDKMNEAARAAAFEDITDVPPELISVTVEFKKSATSKIRKVLGFGISITELSYAMEQGAKMMEVTLPFQALKIVFDEQLPAVGG